MRTIKTAAMALAVPGLLAAAAPASAVTTSLASVATQSDSWQHNRDYRHGHRGDYGRERYYDEPVYNNTRVWRGDDGRYYCRKKNGTTGLIIGGAAGALIGREVDGGRDRTLGTIIGAAGGALLGRSIDRNGSRCR